uniref:Hydrolase_4 domain-containing protein n=1 Tax=Globodera pallida TaxID=36090 RepID=A0A183BXK4_GLOPA
MLILWANVDYGQNFIKHLMNYLEKTAKANTKTLAPIILLHGYLASKALHYDQRKKCRDSSNLKWDEAQFMPMVQHRVGLRPGLDVITLTLTPITPITPFLSGVITYYAYGVTGIFA